MNKLYEYENRIREINNQFKNLDFNINRFYDNLRSQVEKEIKIKSDYNDKYKKYIKNITNLKRLSEIIFNAYKYIQL